MYVYVEKKEKILLILLGASLLKLVSSHCSFYVCNLGIL